MPARGMHGRASEWMTKDIKESKGGRMDSVRACSCEAVEIAHRQSQWLDCEALVPPRVRPSSACRASKKLVDLDRYRGPLAVLVGANFHSGDEFSIEGRTEEGKRKCMNSAKGRGFNACLCPSPKSLCPSPALVSVVLSCGRGALPGTHSVFMQKTKNARAARPQRAQRAIRRRRRVCH